MTTENNVFNENIDFLKKAREDVVELDRKKAKSDDMKNQDKRMLKQISQEEKSIADEIASTLKKRKTEIGNSYDKQLDANRGKLKDIKTKREKVKSKRVGERVDTETAELKEEIRQLKIEIKTLFKQQHIPSFCNSKVYYSLFMPKGFGEILNFLLGFILGIGGLPAVVYAIFRFVVFKEKDMGNIIPVIVVAAVIILVFLLYFIVYNSTKLKYRDTLMDGRQIRDKIKACEKNIKAVKNSINKDKDESGYDLHKYDDKLEKLQKEAEDISKQKQEALTVFEKKTKKLIVDEINNRRLDKLNKMKNEHKKAEVSIQKIGGQISEMEIAITNNYGAFLGKELCTADKLADLISLMNDGTASTVSEAIAAYKGQ